jgi:sugar phosphate isomerase/epimerase
VVDDEGRRKKGFEEARRNMDPVQRVGGKRLAAPPVGAADTEVNLHRAADRYRALLEWGDRMGVVPEAELWGFSRTLGRLGDAVLVAIDSNHPKACILPDVFHLYKGGSDFSGFRLLSGSSFHVIHFNDYPAKPGRAGSSPGRCTGRCTGADTCRATTGPQTPLFSSVSAPVARRRLSAGHPATGDSPAGPR